MSRFSFCSLWKFDGSVKQDKQCNVFCYGNAKLQRIQYFYFIAPSMEFRAGFAIKMKLFSDKVTASRLCEACAISDIIAGRGRHTLTNYSQKRHQFTNSWMHARFWMVRTRLEVLCITNTIVFLLTPACLQNKAKSLVALITFAQERIQLCCFKKKRKFYSYARPCR